MLNVNRWNLSYSSHHHIVIDKSFLLELPYVPTITHKVRLVLLDHYSDVIINAMAKSSASRLCCSTVCSGADQRKYQSSVPLAFMRGVPWWPEDSPHKGPITRKMFPFDDVIMYRSVLPIYFMLTPIVGWYQSNNPDEHGEWFGLIHRKQSSWY